MGAGKLTQAAGHIRGVFVDPAESLLSERNLLDFWDDMFCPNFTEEGKGVGLVDGDRKNLPDLSGVAIKDNNIIPHRSPGQLLLEA